MQYAFFLYWFTKGWWKYLLDKAENNKCRGWKRFWCRARVHHGQMVWEKDNIYCKRCNDIIA